MCGAHEAGVDADTLVMRIFDAFNSRDVETSLLPMLHRDVVFEPVSGVVMNEGKPYIGHDGIRLYFRHVAEHWQQLEVNPMQTRRAGTAVVALGQVSGKGPGGILDAVPTTWVFKFRDGLVAQIQIFSDERLARRALMAAEEEPV
ncbi:MAG: nuclear transport factor 2 family protein [Solirubrobacteraceae bacterium]